MASNSRSAQGEIGNNFVRRMDSTSTTQEENTLTPTDNNQPMDVDNTMAENSNTRRLTSQVWKVFKRVTMNGTMYAVCGQCKKRLKAPSKNGTKHLHVHLEKTCPKRKSNQDIGQAFLKSKERADGKVEYRSHVFDQEVSRQDLAHMIILHEYPLSIVDHMGFRKFISGLQPMFKIVSRNTIKKDIFEVYRIEKVKATALLDSVGRRVAITTDMWTAKPTKRGYMAITAHFIDEECKLRSLILRFVYVPIPHTHDVIRDVLVETLLSWNIDTKLSTVTVDNATTNDAALDSILEKLDTGSLLLDGEVLHMRCCAHILNLIVRDGLKVIEEGIGKIRESCYFWTASQGRKEKFEEAARFLKISYTKCLALDVKTRWNSTYHMLQTAIMYKDVFSRLKVREKLYVSLPTEEDWNLAGEICAKLKLFNSVTELFSGTSYPTSNCYFPKICEIKVELSKWVSSPIEVVRDMAFKMLEKYNKYWSVCHVIMGIACVLDPRYKMKLVEYYYPIIYGNGGQDEIKKIRSSCYKLLLEYQSRLVDDEMINVSSSEMGGGGFADFEEVEDPLAKFDEFVSNNSSSELQKSELDFYLEEKVLPRTPNFDILSWWKTNGIKFPTLRKMAGDILAIQVSTVASESSFSKGGKVVTQHRSRLRPETLEALMCAQSWLWSDEKAGTSKSVITRPPNINEDEDEDVDMSGITTC